MAKRGEYNGKKGYFADKEQKFFVCKIPEHNLWGVYFVPCDLMVYNAALFKKKKTALEFVEKVKEIFDKHGIPLDSTTRQRISIYAQVGQMFQEIKRLTWDLQDGEK